MGSLEKRYAEALLALADNVEQADSVGSALNVLGKLYRKSYEFRSLMLNPVISNNNRSETLLGILEMLGYIKSNGETADNLPKTRRRSIKTATGNTAAGKGESQKSSRKSKKSNAACDPDYADSIPAADMRDLAAESDGTAADAYCDDCYFDDDAAANPDYDDEEAVIIVDAGILVLRFLELLLEKGRIAFLPIIAEEYISIKNKHRNGIHIIARSPAPLDSKQLVELCEKYKTQYGAANAEIDNIIEPSLYGGVSIQIGDMRVDDTLYGRLSALARAVTAGAVKQTV